MQENKLEANFDITSFRIEGDNFGIDIYTNEEIWTPLEITMKKKYVTLDHTYSRGYRPLHYPEYMFVRCPEISSDQCQILIDIHLPTYRIYKDITATKVPMYLLYTVR